MANLSIRNNFPTRFFAERDPFKAMRDMLNWSGLPDLPAESAPATYLPAFDVKETKDTYVFKADMPGVKEADIEVTYQDNQLMVRGKRDHEKEEQGDTYYTYERSSGSFARSFTLPGGVDPDHVRAELKEGVLTIAIPKKPESQAKKISILAPKAKG